MQLINGATIGIFNGITSTDAFCTYVQAANMNMVGVIPSLVKAWQASGATDRCDWSCVRRWVTDVCVSFILTEACYSSTWLRGDRTLSYSL